MCTYGEFNTRVNRLAHALAALGLQRGDRVAILSENRCEYLELAFAGAKLGLILCALNWRLTEEELAHCIRLTTPKAALVSERFAGALSALEHGCHTIIELGADYEKRLAAQPVDEPDIAAQPEDWSGYHLHQRNNRTAQGRPDQPPGRDREAARELPRL